MEQKIGWSRGELLSDASILTTYLRHRLRTNTVIPPAAQAAGARAASVLAPLYARSSLPYLLFTRRSANLTAHRGEISFPGGARDAGEPLEWTALRETSEELGLDPSSIDLLGPLPPVFTAVSNFYVTPYVGWLGDELPALAPNPAEVAEVIEAPLIKLDDPAIYHTEIWTHSGSAHTIHFYVCGAYTIWGATARMLNSLLGLLPPD